MIRENIKTILSQLPQGVELVAATKERSSDEINEAIEGGVKIIGENYIKEAEAKFELIGKKARWHLIGHLQSNKAKAAVKIFDLIETLDSLDLAVILDKECKKINKVMPVLVEVNSASEPQKRGVLPDQVETFLNQLLAFSNLKLSGLMTMGPWLEDPEAIRPYFRKTKELFDKIKANYQGKIEMKYLSMGMSSSWRIAIEEGANIVRIGTAIFGKRKG
ncbi:MAG: YggS family pyridoxal phosphate-dependent enzyme [Candidatus Omnitrophica bacterium]|nr:YggS family pyridoxal phosphate-dependent enzyme [Candidatus Omnitrophota bacterium]